MITEETVDDPKLWKYTVKDLNLSQTQTMDETATVDDLGQ